MESGVFRGGIPVVEALPSAVKSEGGSRVFYVAIGAVRFRNLARISVASQVCYDPISGIERLIELSFFFFLGD